VLSREVASRESSGSELRIRSAGFPARKAIEEFNFEHQPGLNRDTIPHLATAPEPPRRAVPGLTDDLLPSSPQCGQAPWCQEVELCRVPRMALTRRPSAQTAAVLRALSDEPTTWRYGYELVSQLGIGSGSLYPILMRLTDRGLLEADWETDGRPGRPARHLYRLTAAGLDFVAALASIVDQPPPRRVRLQGA